MPYRPGKGLISQAELRKGAKFMIGTSSAIRLVRELYLHAIEDIVPNSRAGGPARHPFRRAAVMPARTTLHCRSVESFLHSGVRKRTRNVCRWRDVDMVERWVASAYLLTEKSFRRIDGHEEI